MKKERKEIIFRKFNENEKALIQSKKKNSVIIYYIILLAMLIFSIGYYFITKGFYFTIKRIILLFICAIAGFALFYLIYFIFILVDYLVKKIKRNNVTEKISYPDELENLYLNNKFTYNTKLPLKENLLTIKNLFIYCMSETFKYGKKNTKYVMFDYSIEDAIKVVLKIENDVYGKVDSVFSMLRYNNKPLSFVENKLIETISKNDDVEQDEQLKENNFFSKIKDNIKKKSINIGISVGTRMFKNPINDLVNDLLKYSIQTSFDLSSGNISKEDSIDENS